MKKIYFDNELINPDYYAELSKTSQIFQDNKFKLGATLCEVYTFKIDKDFITNKNPDVIYLYDNTTLEKTLFIDSVEEDDFTITYNLVDSMVNFNFGYDASSIFVDNSTTLGAIFQDICLKANISTDITTFDYSSMEISWYDNTITARSYLGFIAELNGSYCYITPDNKLAMKEINSSSVDTIQFDEIGKYSIGSYHKYSRVLYETQDFHWEYGSDTYDTYYVNTANVFITDESMIEHIYDYINGFEFYNFEIENLPINNSIAGNIITITDGTNSYKTITEYSDLKLGGSDWYGSLKIEVENEKQQETEIIDVDKRIRGIKQTLDRDGNQIQTLIEDTTVLNRKVSDNTTNINNNYQEIIEKFNDVASVDDVSLLRQAMQTTMNEQELKIENIQSAVVNGVEKVINTSGTFDDNGLTMEKTGAKTKSVLNETGLDIQDSQGYSNEDLFFSGYVDSNKAQSNADLTNYEGQTIVYTKNIIVKNYLSIGTHSRLEDYEDGTGAFPIGG